MNELDLAEGRSGFRLDSVELYNWGTFGRSVWSFPFGGENALITGDIGSGKSTWVDALTTLLVPPQRITYNKAAGAERRERTDKSYVLGEYRSSRGEGSANSTNLRNEGCYSVLAAVFTEKRSSRLLSLAQVRWIKAGEVQRLYVTSGRRLSILADFGDFTGDGPALKKRLRLAPGTEVFDSYADYSASFRTSMGISEKALDLFNQTVSMKTIGDLDDFIRDRMLEPTSAAERLSDILRNFDNLRAAHDAVESSRKQRDALLPIAEEGREHGELLSSIDRLRSMAQALPYFSTSLGIPLLEREIERLGLELASEAAAMERLTAEKATKDETRSSLRSAIDNSEAGRRIREISAELERVAEERDRRRLAAGRYGETLGRLGRPIPGSAESLVALRAELEAERTKLVTEAVRLGDERDSRFLERDRAREGIEKLQTELESLKRRTTSIPSRDVELRRALAEAVGADEADLPFAGELIRVRAEERAWEGAAERVLRSLALSILVPERLYRGVSDHVRSTRLDARLVYFRVSEKPGEMPRLSEPSLARVFEVKPGSPFRPWLEVEIARRAGYVRCEDIDHFYREPDAVTPEGLVKSGRIRHEKDDRRSVADPRNFVLGWSNRDKINLLERDLGEAREALATADRRFGDAEHAVEGIESRMTDISEALRTSTFDEIDVAGSVERYCSLKDERERLEASSDQLAGLKAALDMVSKELALLDAELGRANQRAGASKPS